LDIYTETASVGSFHRWGTMEGSSKGLQRQAIRMKSDIMSWPRRDGKIIEEKYCVRPGLYCALIFLLDTSDGEPLAITNDGYSQHIRVGALVGLGTKEDASIVGMLGAEGMARSHLMAFAGVRKIKKPKVYSPTKASRELYAEEMAEQLSIDSTVFAGTLEPGMPLTQVAGEYADDVYPKVDVCIGGDPKS
jgi:alanine dehydrogenase